MWRRSLCRLHRLCPKTWHSESCLCADRIIFTQTSLLFENTEEICAQPKVSESFKTEHISPPEQKKNDKNQRNTYKNKPTNNQKNKNWQRSNDNGRSHGGAANNKFHHPYNKYNKDRKDRPQLEVIESAVEGNSVYSNKFHNRDKYKNKKGRSQTEVGDIQKRVRKEHRQEKDVEIKVECVNNRDRQDSLLKEDVETIVEDVNSIQTCSDVEEECSHSFSGYRRSAEDCPKCKPVKESVHRNGNAIGGVNRREKRNFEKQTVKTVVYEYLRRKLRIPKIGFFNSPNKF